MQPEIHLGPLTLQSFGIAFALAFIAAGAVLGRRLKEIGKPTDWAYELVICALVGGIVGARLNYVIQNYDAVKGDLLGNLFSGSGLVWFGGAIGGAIAVGLWAWRRKMLNLTLLDICAVPLAVGYALGRIGCQVSGDGDYGKAWDGPVGDGLPPRNEADRHAGAAHADLRDARHGPRRLLPLASARPGPAGRPLRDLPRVRRHRAAAGGVHPPQHAEFLGLTQPQLISVVMMIAGGIWLAVKARRGELTRDDGGATVLNRAPA